MTITWTDLKKAQYEIMCLRAKLLGLYRKIGKQHPDVCFDPDCDGTCQCEFHPFEKESGHD